MKNWKWAGLGTLLLVLASCQSAPDSFCTCLKISENLNSKAQKILNGNGTEEDKAELIELRKKQKASCAEYADTKGPDMRDWKKSCEDK